MARWAARRWLESEQRLRQIIDLVPHMIFVKDRDGRFLLANKAVADACGTQVNQLVGRAEAEFARDPEQYRRGIEADRKVIDEGEAWFSAEEPFLDARGELRLLETTKVPFLLPDGASRAALGFARDITDRRRAQNAVRTRERELSLIYDNVSDVIPPCRAPRGCGVYARHSLESDLQGTCPPRDGGQPRASGATPSAACERSATELQL